MTRLKSKWIVGVVATMISVAAIGQPIDQEKMDRDLEISKNILQTLFNENSEGLFWGPSIEASYLKGFGVIFTMPNSNRYAFSSFSRSTSRSRVVTGSSGVVVDTEPFIIREINSDSLSEANFENSKKHIVTFFADYADLIGQLRPEERIKITSKSNSFDAYVIGYGSSSTFMGSSGGGFSAEIKKQDITAYRSGKLSRSGFEGKVVFEKSKPHQKIQDLELFASIMRRLYSPDLSSTFFTSSTPRYERIDNYGAIFYMKTFSSYSEDNLYRMPVLDRSDVTNDERKKTIIQLYPKFEKELSRNMIEYGRTISSLNQDEVLSMNVTLTRCNDCGIPKSIVATISASILSDFNKGKISLENAIAKVEIRENVK